MLVRGGGVCRLLGSLEEQAKVHFKVILQPAGGERGISGVMLYNVPDNNYPSGNLTIEASSYIPLSSISAKSTV